MDKTHTPPEPLTEREKEILHCISTGLSDQEVATTLYLSFNTVRWYNRQIYSKLGVASRTQAVARAKKLGLLGTVDAPSLPALGTSLPRPATALVRRERETTQLIALIHTSRLLTLTGVGGTGKTRLALHVASALTATFAEGVCFVDLAPVHDANLVVYAIAAALHIVEHAKEPLRDTLRRLLAPREILLLLDNFEHLIPAAPLLAELLAASPSLKLLVTSREALRLSGEQEFQVPPLSLPSLETPSIQAITTSEAGALFLQRARSVNPRFEISDDNAAAIAQICTRLDGLPLAIELAAVRCKVLSPQLLLERLKEPLHLLTGGMRDAPERQRTLRNTIEWSYNLLNEQEKRLFARMALFVGGCTLEAIEVVCGAGLETDIFEIVVSLVDKSLVQQQETRTGEPRFFLLETIRDFALERLQESGEREIIQEHYVNYFVSLVEQAEPQFRLDQQKRWFQRVATEQENLRVVLEASLRAETVTSGIRIAGALSWYWYISGHHVEGLEWMQRLLPLLDHAAEQYHPKFLIGAAHMRSVRNLDNHLPLLKRALTIAHRLGNRHHTAAALIRLGYATMQTPDAVPTVEEGIALFRDLNYTPGVAHGLTIIGEIYRVRGNIEGARLAYEETLNLCRPLGDTRGTLITLLNLTFVACHQAQDAYAVTLAREALRLAHDLGLHAEMVECLAAFAGTIGATGHPHLAASLFGTVERTLERLGAFYDAPDRQEFESMVAAIRADLPPHLFQSAWQEGRQLTLEQAITHALHDF